MCGCKLSTVENNELYNEDTNVRHRFLFGVHVLKDTEGVEGNVQLACGTIRKKKFERVANTGEQIVNNLQTPAQQIEDTLHDSG